MAFPAFLIGWHRKYTPPEGLTIPNQAPLIMQQPSGFLSDLGERERERAWKLLAAQASYLLKHTAARPDFDEVESMATCQPVAQ